MASKNTYQVQPQAALTDDEFFARLDAVAGVKQEATEKPKESAGVLRTAGDLGLKATQGVVGLGQAAIGLGNLATGGLLGKGMRKAGYDPERTNQAIGEYLSDSQKESDRKVQEADGFFGTAQAMLENPRSIIGGAAQSAPGMLLGGGITSAVARRIGAAAAAPLGGLQTPAGQAAAKAAVEKAAGRLMLTGSSAEGAQAAGQIAEKAEREGRGWGDYVLPSVGAGIGTAAIGRATGKLMGDSETAIFSGAKSAAAKGSLPVRVVKSGASEGIEETLQSGQQQSMENIALGKEWDDEIDKAMGQGLVVGSAMGLGTGAFTRADNARQQQAVASAQQSGGIVSRAGLAATPGAQQPSPAAPNPAATRPTAAAAPGAAGQPAATPAAGPVAPAAQAQPAQTPIQASALSAIEQALEADKQRRRAAGEVVEDEVEEGDVVAAGNPAAVDPPDATPPPAMQAQPTQPAQPASAGFSLPAFDNSPIPKMDPAAADEQRRQATEAQGRRRKRVAALRLGAYNKNPMMEFLGRHGLQPEEQNEFAPGNTERRKAAVYGYGPVFRKNGKPLDLLLANAQDEGFLPPDSSESDLRDLVSRTINGERVEPLYKAGIADDLMQRLATEREAKEAASYEDYLREHGQAVESGDFDPLDSIGTTGYDFGDDDLADYAAATPPLQAEVAALSQHYYDLGFDPDEVLERLSIETENQPEQAYYDLAKSRFTQLIEQALSPGRREGSTEQGGGGAVRRDAGQASAAQADGSAAGGQGQTAAVTPPAAPAAAQPRRADAIRAKLDGLKAQGFSQFTRSSGRTLLLNPDTYETVELTPAEMVVAKAASGQARAGLQSLRGQRKPAQVDQQGVDALQSYSPADVLAQEEQASQQQAADQAERDKAQAQARADDERRRIEQASYAAADSFELGQNPLDSLTGQKDIFGAAPVAQGLAGERINDEWTAFDPQSGTLGIPRAEMPQIKAEHRGAMMGFLKARGIDGQQESIPSSAIKPTQAEFSPAKVKKALDREGGSRSIIVSADGHVVDGHHQWLAAREKGEPIQAIRLDQNIGDVLAALKDMPSAQPEQAAPDRELKSGPAAVPPPEFASFEAKKALLELSQELVSAEGGLNERGNALARTPWGELSESDRVLALKLSQDKQASNDASNARVREGMRQIRRRQLQNERTITQANGKPFKTEAGAKAMLDQFDLGDTHKIVSEGGGYALRQMPPAEQAEVRRKAEGRESYMEAQAAVIAEMGIPLTADGEIDATDEQWDEIDQRIAERLGRKPAASKQPAVQPNAGPQSDDPIASRPFATVIEKTKTGWRIVGDPDALAEHARDIFGKGVVKRKDGISLATKTDDVAGNFPARFDEYRLADLPERHGRIEVRVNQDGSASVRSLDGGYMGPQLPSVAEAIANHRKTFGGSDSSVKQTDVQPAGSTAAATKATQMKTVRDVADKLGMEYVSGLLADSLKKGQTFDMLGKQYAVTTVTDSRIRLKSSDGKTIEALKYGNKLVSGGNAKSQPYAQFVRDLEGVISVDLINESNPFHKPSEVFVLAQRALDALPADMKAVRPEGAAEVGNADQAETGRDGYDTPIELDAAQLKAILEQTRGEPLVDKPAKLEAWRNGTAKTDPDKFPIELVFRSDGKLDVNDGRHRIALAAERGEKVTAFIDGKDAQRAKDLLAMREQQTAASGAANPDLEAIFDQLDGITQRTQAAGQQAAAAHPQAERIQFVQKHILDILEDLEDSGKVTINC